FPSISEGFGMPILEAMTYETPVITSNVSSLSEIAKDAAVTIDPFSVHELADAMLTVLNNDDLRNSLIARGKERAKQFSWTTCAKQTVDVYKQAVGSNIDSEACVKR
ncbi:MAG: glycosyltransferase, partial [Thermoanaerobaculia bacterium]|nr:glycosyltransferase [Thermoanaerobaculia bacterium]